ncbi:uncharacterized protein RSE6_11122 [Rhynchosporium secalis]|uniref:Uncharacterized protein n=1 Tax=Rhynchosporium secalis TaxID=38038 RepID=A0A1E1MM72_RHYSE|nr:uncharacterized protein RSE6_11122 [Rhynchosporium secalis]
MSANLNNTRGGGFQQGRGVQRGGGLQRGGAVQGVGVMQRGGEGFAGRRNGGRRRANSVGSNTGTGNSAQPWGLMGDNRPPTPSEGRAQIYQRVGPTEQQRTRSYDNGTSLTFGPNDLLAEPIPGGSFDQQFLEINAAVRDLQVNNAQGALSANTIPAGNNAVHADFRMHFPPPQQLRAAQYPDGTVYNVVPSRMASVEVLPHVRSLVRHMSDAPGEAHPGDTVDTRHGDNRGQLIVGNVPRRIGDVANHNQAITATGTSQANAPLPGPRPNTGRFEDSSLSRFIREQDQTRERRQ